MPASERAQRVEQWSCRLAAGRAAGASGCSCRKQEVEHATQDACDFGGDDFDYTYGAGVQYHFSNFGVRAEWQRYNDTFGRVDTDVVMGSVMFRF